MLEIFWTIFGQSGLDLWIFLGSYETDCRTVDWPMCAAFVLLLKMNNMLVVCKLYYYMRI